MGRPAPVESILDLDDLPRATVQGGIEALAGQTLADTCGKGKGEGVVSARNLEREKLFFLPYTAFPYYYYLSEIYSVIYILCAVDSCQLDKDSNLPLVQRWHKYPG